MRKINGIIAMLVLVLFVVHGILGALNMMNIATIIVKVLSHTMLSLIVVHAVLSIILTVRSVRTAVKTKAPYSGQDKSALFPAKPRFLGEKTQRHFDYGAGVFPYDGVRLHLGRRVPLGSV